MTKALTLEHHFQTRPNLLLDLQYASLTSTDIIRQSSMQRIKPAQRLVELAERSEHLDKAIWETMPEPVKVASATARLGLLTVWTFLLRWPDWQLTTLYTRGFKLAGIMEPSNICPQTCI